MRKLENAADAWNFVHDEIVDLVNINPYIPRGKEVEELGIDESWYMTKLSVVCDYLKAAKEILDDMCLIRKMATTEREEG